MHDGEQLVDEKMLLASATTSTDSKDVCIDMPNDIGAEEIGQGDKNEDNWFAKWFSGGQKDLYSTHCRILEDCPEGYPRLAAFLSSDHNFMLYRSFSYLHSRLLLHQQYELTRLEKELDDKDKEDVENGHADRLQSRNTDDSEAENENQSRSRTHIMADIRKKLLNYDEILTKARELVAFQRPSNRDYRSVRTWFYNLPPLVARESEFIRCKEDIVTLRHGRECAGFDGFVESVLQKFDCKLTQYLFRTPDLRIKTKDKHLFYYSPSRVDKLVGLIITGVIFVLLIIPVVAMYQLTDVIKRDSTFHAIGVLIVFTLLFSATMSLLTKAKRHELFAASAAYCAILVVFIGNFGNLPPR